MSFQQYLTDNLSFTMNGYYTMLTGLHAFADDNKTTKLYHNDFNGIPVDYVEVFVNEGRQISAGGSIQLNWKHSIENIHLNSYASVSYVNGEIDNPATAVGDNDGDKQLDFISPVMIRVGTDLKMGKFTCSPRLLINGRQNLSGIRDTVGLLARRQTISGYALLNISVRYNISKQASFFANVSNALNRRYRSVGFKMDLNNTHSEVFNGQPEDPIRIAGGFNLSF
jgi:outer membrane receptor protein involved in Fe transport